MKKKSNEPLTMVGIGKRFLAALTLVLVTFNPTGISAFHWIFSAIGASTFGILHLLLLVVLLAGWSMFWIATWRALGNRGVTIAAIGLAVVIFLLINAGLLSISSMSAATWVILVCIAVVLTIGASWSYVQRLTQPADK